ncbi:MAG TPA: PLP-dependent aminotransferase family protein, partial [Trebonia sp.]|nr:PLP-dependent aminotransferase family protein [Trebonia sp.]
VHRANGFFAGLLGSTTVEADLTMACVDCAPEVARALASPADFVAPALHQALLGTSGYYPYGLPELRAAIAAMLTSRHGLTTKPEEVIVTSGAQQALDLLIRCELVPGQPAIVEDPTFPGMLDALQRSGARPVGVPPGDPARLARAIAAHRPGLAYLIPAHHNPLGVSMTADAAQQVVGLARANPDVVVIDDMTMADLPLGGRPPAPLAALAPGLPNLVTVGSLSKTYWAGLRLGWVRAPAGIIARLAAAKAAVDLGSTAYQQAIVAAVIAELNESILTARLAWLQPRYEALAAALDKYLPDWTWARPQGGLSVWARLPGGADAGTFAQAALRRGVGLVPGRLLSTSGDDEAARHVRLSYAQPPEVLTEAVRRLAEIELR